MKTGERRDRDKCTKGIKEIKKDDEGLRYEVNHSPFNLNGLFTLKIMFMTACVTR
jgi:hypothetical protein